MAKRSRGRRGRGDKRERELVPLFQEWGLEARRVELPTVDGTEALDEPGADTDIYKIGREPPLVGACKTQRDGFKQLYAWLEDDSADYLALRTEQVEWLFVLPEREMRELLTQ